MATPPLQPGDGMGDEPDFDKMTDEEFNRLADEHLKKLDDMPRPKRTREDAPMDGVVVEPPRKK
jgi:hypothetical protein